MQLALFLTGTTINHATPLQAVVEDQEHSSSYKSGDWCERHSKLCLGHLGLIDIENNVGKGKGNGKDKEI